MTNANEGQWRIFMTIPDHADAHIYTEDGHRVLSMSLDYARIVSRHAESVLARAAEK